MRKLLVLATVAVAAAVLAVPAFGATKNVNIGDIYFISKAKNKGTINAKVGDTIKWKWVGKFPHDVKTTSSAPARISSGSPKKSGTYSKKLTKAGTYKIFCSVHTAAKQAMTLKVTR